MKKKIVIIGAGPTGLGAAYRLHELGHADFAVLERRPYLGGLCASFRDQNGFTWDLGGHVIFSRFPYFDRLMNKVLKNGFRDIRREAWVRVEGCWVPYPFQKNLDHLPEAIRRECLDGLKASEALEKKNDNFEHWILTHMGNGIARHFMFPYNAKVWAHPLDQMSTSWLTDRVSSAQDAAASAGGKPRPGRTGWGPNGRFRYPVAGGVREIFNKIGELFPEKILTNAEAVRVDPWEKKVFLSGGRVLAYEALINTSPLDHFVATLDDVREEWLTASRELKHNSVLVVGIGVRKPCPDKKCWMYFPGGDCPFYRVTYLANYSPNNVPDEQHHSLLCEVSYSEHKRENKEDVVERTIQGLVRAGLLEKDDVRLIVSRFLFDIGHAYPIPTLTRDAALEQILPALEKLDIFSRGRFGAWKYEVGNVDHSIIQGKEAVDRILGVGGESLL
ncbi:MAG: FAD-dependent oxidoreductase [Candidatus Omnitrophota bacterium]|nr:FAD-dependent oxidoreductase [Candidatus Omnitrophota bacterium]MDZ4241938.1 FAD-dependent oxidoreductase [Candidatus Omnitrophota bacterium]